MNDRILRTLAIVAAAVTACLAVLSVGLIVATPGLDMLSGWGFQGYDALFAVVYLAVGLLITTLRPRNVIGWLFLISAVLSGVQTVVASYAAHALLLGRPGGALAFWITAWIWIPAVAVILVSLLLYPNGRLPSRRWRWAPASLIVVTAFVTFIWAVATPPDATTPEPFAVDPLALGPEHPLRDIAGPSLLLLTAYWLVAAASLVSRMRGGDAVVRQQVKWIAFASLLVGLTLGVSVGVTLFSPPDESGVLAKGTQIVSVLSVLAIPIAATFAILRYRLYDIDLLINRTLVYSALTAALLATYFAVVVLFQSLLRPFTAGNELAVAGSTLATLALVQPLRRRIQDAVDRRFYRSRYDAARTLDAFSVRLRDEVDLDAVRADLLGAVRDTVRPAHATVWLRGDHP